MRLEVVELLKQGYLKELLTERGRVTRDKSSNKVSYAAAKQSSRRMAPTEIHKTGAHNPEALQIINFHSDESNYANDLHDDALVISLSIANCLTKWILVDNGSSANVFFLNVYREMGLKEENIIRRCISLVGSAVN